MLTKTTPALNAESMALLFAADRLDHLEKVVAPQIRAGSIVLSDRFVTSSYAYQAVENRWNREINKYIASYPRPNLTFYLSVPVDVVLSRIQIRDGERRELFEHREALQRAYDVYERECYQADWVRIDGTMPPDKVHKEVVEAFERICA